MNKKNFKYDNWFFPKARPSDQRGKTLPISNFIKEDKDTIYIFFREYIQNVLDARSYDSSGVRNNAFLKIKILDLGAEKVIKYCGDVAKRLIEAGHSLERMKKSMLDGTPGKIPCLIIEEDGTTGLRGETQNSELDGPTQQWNSFWIGEGNENKSGKDLGRRGEGKIVKHIVSSLSSVFAVTNQKDEKKNLLMGKCVFSKNYKYDGKTYQRHAYFCDKIIIDGQEQQIPIQDTKIIDQFKKDFQITRDYDDGTSWVIPLINSETFNIQNIVQAIISEFYIAITKGELSLNISGQIIDSGNLVDVMEKFHVFDPNTKIYVDWVISSISSWPNLVDVDQGWFTDANSPADESKIKKIEDLRIKFNNNETISLNVPIVFQRISGKLKTCNLNVFLKNNTDFNNTRGAYIRDCLIIDKEEKWIKNIPGNFFGLALAVDEDLIDFLGDAEDASHLEWNPKEPNLAKNYLKYQTTLAQVRRSVPAFLQSFSQIKRSVYEDIFTDLISIPLIKAKRKKIKTTKTKTTRKTHTKTPPIFRIEQSKDSLKIKTGPGASAITVPSIIDIEFAYSLLGEKGNPFNQYHKFDFDLSESYFKYTNKGCKILNKNLNRLELEITNIDYFLEIKGFEETSVEIREKH